MGLKLNYEKRIILKREKGIYWQLGFCGPEARVRREPRSKSKMD